MKKIQRFLIVTLLYTTLWLWRLLVLAVILLAVLVSVGRELAPLLKENKTWLEGHLTTLGGYPVQMESVEARWEGLTPEVRATGLVVGQSVSVERALLRVDLLRSAVHQTLVFDALSIQGAVLDIPVDAADVDAAEKIDIHTGLNFLFGSANIRLRDIALHLQRASGETLTMHIPALDVGNAGQRHWLQGSFTAADAAQPVEIIGAFTGNAGKLLAGEGSAYLDFGDGSKIRPVLAFVMNQQEPAVDIGTPGGVQGRAWLNWRENKLNWTATVNVQNLEIAKIGYSMSYAGNLAGHFVIRDGIFDAITDAPRYELMAGIPQGALLINQQSYHVPEWSLRYQSSHPLLGDEAALSVHLPQFDLSTLKDYRGLITQRELRKTLDVLKPQGMLRHITLTLPAKPASTFKPVLRANLEQVSVAAWQGAPALQQVDAYLEASAYEGFVEVESKNGFSMHFPDLYAKAMTYERVRGRVSWHVDPRRRDVHVGSAGIDLAGEDGKGHAAFWVDIPARHDHPGEMYLTVGLEDAVAAHRHKYLPDTLPHELQQWLNNSIKNGKLAENGFIYRGALSGEEQERSILYYGKVRDGALRFDPAWPLLSGIDATVLVDNSDVRVDVKKAHLQALTLDKAVVEVKSGHFLTVQGDVKGNGDHALDLLRKTPLRKTLGSTFDAWQLEDDIRGRISLGIALDKNTEKDFQEVAITLDRNNLHLKDLALSLEHLTGNVYYSSSLGLSASQLKAQLWKQALDISITPVNDQDGLPDILINTNGVIEPEQLAAWSHLPFIHFLRGSIPVQGKLEIPLDIAEGHASAPLVALGFFSDLRGVALDLPTPLNKAAEASQPLVVKVDVFKDHQAYQVAYGSQAAARIEIPAQGSLRGQVWINQPAETTETLPEGLNIYGHLEKALLQDWVKVIERYGKLPAQKPLVAAAGKNETPFPVFHFTLDDFQLGELALGSTRLTVSRVEDKNNRCWQAGFDHSAASGAYRYFDDVARLPELGFERLDLDEWKRLQGGEAQVDEEVEEADDEMATESPDPLADVVPQDLPALQVYTKQLIYKTEDLGQWRFTLQPQPWGAALENFSATMTGLTIGGIQGDQGASILWHRDKAGMETEISARITQTMRNDGVKTLFGTDRIIEAAKTEIVASLAWKGSPVNMQFRNLKGDVRISSEKGRFLNSTTSTDLMRVINVFNFNTWARRLKLDFSDLYKKGVSYDRVKGHVQLDQGKMVFDEPLVMESPSSRFTLQGSIDSVNNSINADLAVTLPVGDNAAWVTALAGGLPAAVGVWAVSKIFEKQIDNLSSVSYTISGELDNPDIAFKHLLKDMPKKNSEVKLLPTDQPEIR